MGFTDLPGNDGQVTSDKKVILICDWRDKGGKKRLLQPFSVTFEATGKFSTVFGRLTLRKKEFDRVNGRRREIDIKYEFDFNIIFKDLAYK